MRRNDRQADALRPDLGRDNLAQCPINGFGLLKIKQTFAKADFRSPNGEKPIQSVNLGLLMFLNPPFSSR